MKKIHILYISFDTHEKERFILNIETVHQLRQYFSNNANYLEEMRKNFQEIQAEVVKIHDTQRLIVLPKTYHLQRAKQSSSSSALVKEIKANKELTHFDEKVEGKIEQLGLSLIRKVEVSPTVSPTTSAKIEKEETIISALETFFLKDTLPDTLTPLKKRKATKEDVQTISDMTLSFFAKGLVKNNLNIYLQVAIMSEWYLDSYAFMAVTKDSEELLTQLDELNAAVSHLPPFDVDEFLMLVHSRIQVFTLSLARMVQNVEEIHHYNDKLITLSQYSSMSI